MAGRKQSTIEDRIKKVSKIHQVYITQKPEEMHAFLITRVKKIGS